MSKHCYTDIQGDYDTKLQSLHTTLKTSVIYSKAHTRSTALWSLCLAHFQLNCIWGSKIFPS